jgi:hypothetical protein
MNGGDMLERAAAAESRPLPHFATNFILGCAKALIAAGMQPEAVSPHRVVYRNGQLRLCAEWDPARRALAVSLGHQRGDSGAGDEHAAVGWRYNLLLEAAGIEMRVPAGSGAGIQASLTEAVRVISRTLPDLVERYREIEPRARELARRPPLGDA